MEKENENLNACFSQNGIQQALTQRTMKEGKYCGNCCWFCLERVDGDGDCVNCSGSWRITSCSDKVCKNYISRKEMRHHMAVLLQWERYNKSPRHSLIVKVPATSDMNNAMKFAYKYMKVFSNL